MTRYRLASGLRMLQQMDRSPRVIATIGVRLGLLIMQVILDPLGHRRAAAADQGDWSRRWSAAPSLPRRRLLHMIGILLSIRLIGRISTGRHGVLDRRHAQRHGGLVGIVVETLARSFVALGAGRPCSSTCSRAARRACLTPTVGLPARGGTDQRCRASRPCSAERARLIERLRLKSTESRPTACSRCQRAAGRRAGARLAQAGGGRLGAGEQHSITTGTDTIEELGHVLASSRYRS